MSQKSHSRFSCSLFCSLSCSSVATVVWSKSISHGGHMTFGAGGQVQPPYLVLASVGLLQRAGRVASKHSPSLLPDNLQQKTRQESFATRCKPMRWNPFSRKGYAKRQLARMPNSSQRRQEPKVIPPMPYHDARTWKRRTLPVESVQRDPMSCSAAAEASETKATHAHRQRCCWYAQEVYQSMEHELWMQVAGVDRTHEFQLPAGLDAGWDGMKKNKTQHL